LIHNNITFKFNRFLLIFLGGFLITGMVSGVNSESPFKIMIMDIIVLMEGFVLFWIISNLKYKDEELREYFRIFYINYRFYRCNDSGYF